MNLIGGVILMALAVAMVVAARPKDGVSANFLKHPWIVGQAYVMSALMLIVVGTAITISNWP